MFPFWTNSLQCTTSKDPTKFRRWSFRTVYTKYINFVTFLAFCKQRFKVLLYYYYYYYYTVVVVLNVITMIIIVIINNIIIIIITTVVERLLLPLLTHKFQS